MEQTLYQEITIFLSFQLFKSIEIMRIKNISSMIILAVLGKRFHF